MVDYIVARLLDGRETVKVAIDNGLRRMACKAQQNRIPHVVIPAVKKSGEAVRVLVDADQLARLTSADTGAMLNGGGTTDPTVKPGALLDEIDRMKRAAAEKGVSLKSVRGLTPFDAYIHGKLVDSRDFYWLQLKANDVPIPPGMHVLSYVKDNVENQGYVKVMLHLREKIQDVGVKFFSLDAPAFLTMKPDMATLTLAQALSRTLRELSRASVILASVIPDEQRNGAASVIMPSLKLVPTELIKFARGEVDAVRNMKAYFGEQDGSDIHHEQTRG